MQGDFVQRHGAIVLGVGIILLVIIVVAMSGDDPTQARGGDPINTTNTKAVPKAVPRWAPLPEDAEIERLRRTTAGPPVRRTPIEQQRTRSALPWQQLPVVSLPQLFEPAMRVVFLRNAPDIPAGAVRPHEDRGPCLRCHKVRRTKTTPVAVTGRRQPRPPSALPVATTRPTQGARNQWTARLHSKTGGAGRLGAATRRLPNGTKTPLAWAEAHWQGIEVVPLTPGVARRLKIPVDTPGVLIDEAGRPADKAGFQAGDMVTTVGGVPTPDVASFVRATEQVRDQRQADVDISRAGKQMRLRIVAARKWLGIAMPETAPMIPPTAKMPHPFRGVCSNCHRLGTTGQLQLKAKPVRLNRPVPPIRRGQRMPHAWWGKCSNCHVIR